MNLIEHSVELLIQQAGIEGIYKQIELAGRTCYKSEDKITDDSAKVFVDRMIESKHHAMLEHGTVYLKIPNIWSYFIVLDIKEKFGQYSTFYIENEICYITTNYRVIIENNLYSYLQYICEPTEYHQRRITLKFTTNIGVTREGNRHRVNSIAEESTRYCNYSNKDKFGSEISFTIPKWVSKEQLGNHNSEEISLAIQNLLNCGNYTKEEYAELIYLKALADAESSYLKLIELGWVPQQAREVLPLSTKSDIVYTAFTSDWKHFFDLRLFGTTGKPHPNMEVLAKKAMQVLKDNNLWKLIYS